MSNQSMEVKVKELLELKRMKEELEAEQDAALAPLNELDTELDLEQQSIDTQLADVKARLESFDALVKDEIKNSAPTFGLG